MTRVLPAFILLGFISAFSSAFMTISDTCPNLSNTCLRRLYYPFQYQPNSYSTKHAVLTMRHFARRVVDDDFAEDEEYEYARIGRKRNREQVVDLPNDEQESGPRVRIPDKNARNDENDIFENDEDDDFDDILPNALLDQVDPDGAIERLPDLVKDPQFWRDAVIVTLLAFFFATGPSPLRFLNTDQVNFSHFYSN